MHLAAILHRSQSSHQLFRFLRTTPPPRVRRYSPPEVLLTHSTCSPTTLTWYLSAYCLCTAISGPLPPVAFSISLMPCTVEFLEPDSFWYCCNCGDGPMVAAVSSACTSCNDHQRCSSNACIPTPPDSPTWPSGTRRKLREYASDLRVSKSGPIVTTSQASPRRNGNLDLDRDVVIASNIEAYKEASITPFDEGQISLQAAIEQHTNAIVDFQHSLLPHVDTTSTPEVTSCPTGRQAPPRAPNNSLQRITQQQPGKRSRRRNAKASGGQKDDQESDDDVSSEPPRGRLALNQNGQPDVELACPFCKFNPHRYRHEKSCGQGKPTASKLRYAGFPHSTSH